MSPEPSLFTIVFAAEFVALVTFNVALPELAPPVKSVPATTVI